MKAKDMPGRKKVSRRQAVVGSLAALFAAPSVNRAFAQGSVVNIGVIVPLSGANAQFGVNSRNGIELVADEINAAGGIKALGGANINLILVDATSNPDAGAIAAQRLITQKELTAVLGAFTSSSTLAISEVTARASIPMITMAFADQITARGLKGVFQITATGSVIGRAQFDYTLAIAAAAGEKVQRVAITYENTAYGTAQSEGIRKAAHAANIAIVMDESYPLGITDAALLVEKMRASGAQAIFLVSYLNDSLFIIRRMRRQGMAMPVIGGAAGYVIPDFEKALRDYAKDVFSISPTNYDLAPTLTEPFRKRFGYFMVHEAIEHAVALYVLVQAIERAKSANPQAVTEALYDARFEGSWTKAMPDGAVRFDRTGRNTLSTPIMVQWRNKELVTVWPKQVAKASAIWRS